jgi:hypothetical protein
MEMPVELLLERRFFLSGVFSCGVCRALSFLEEFVDESFLLEDL